MPGKIGETGETAPAAAPADERAPADMAVLLERMADFLRQRREKATVVQAPYDAAGLTDRFGFSGSKMGRPEVILGEQVAVELGHPSTASKAVVLVTRRPGIVHHGRISIVGPDLDRLEKEQGPHPFAQVVMLAVDREREPDPFSIDNAQFLTHRLPGYMVRSVPGRLWVRISKAGRAAGLDLRAVGSALVAAYRLDFEGVEAVEVVFVTSSRADVEALSVVAAEAEILAGRHKKLVLGVDGEVECRELNCEICEEKPVCDSLRDIVIKRRNRGK